MPGSPPTWVSPNAVLITRLDRVEFVNLAAARLLATPADQLVGRATGELFADDSHKEVVTRVGQLSLEHGVTGPVVGRLARSDGTSPRVEVTATALAADRGHGILWFLRDLDEPTADQRRATEAALVASQHRLQLFVEYAPAALAMFDRDMRYIVASHRWRSDYRLPDAGLIGRSHYDVFPEISDEWRAVHRRALAGETVTADEDRFVRADGSVHWLRWAVRPWFGTTDGIEGVVVFTEDITERRQAENALRESERRFRELLEKVRLIAVMLDMIGRVTFCNDFLLELTGWRAEEVLGQSWFDVFVPQDVRAELKRVFFDPALREEVPVHYESEMLTRSGERRLVAWNNTVLRDAEGRLAGTTSLGKDITERRRVEHSLQESEGRLRLAVAAGRLGVWEWLLDTDAVYWSPEAIAITGVEPTGFGGTLADFIRLVHPNDREVLGEKMAAARSGEGTFAHEFRIVRPDGSARWLVSRGELNRLASGQAVRLIGVVADITERKQAEEQFRDREHRLQAILDTATDAIITIDERGTVESVNPATERLFGYVAGEVVGRNVSALMPQPYSAEHDGYIARYLRTGERRIIGIGREVSGRRKDGTVFPMELAVVEIPGPPRRFTGFVRDITDRKQLEARFLRAQRLESLGSLASGVAHDLNNVLTPVLMAVRLLLKDKPGGQKQAILETALASVERGTGIVRQLLAFGGGVHGEKETVTLAEVVREVIGMMEHTLPKSIALTAHLPADLWPVTGDVTQLSQLLVNLCVNARDAMPAGGEIRISAENFPVDALYAARYPGAKSGRYVLLTVADTGPGIPPEVQERMFDPFFTTKPFGQGTGLGLATVQGIVKAHGGFLTVYSEIGQGAKFLIHLPAGGVVPQPSAESERTTTMPGQERLVLVVDDEPAVRLMARVTLEEVGYRVIDAGDGETALTAYRVGEVAAVVLDMMMPGLDTPSVIRRLRQLDPSARILAVSGLHPSGHAATVLKEFAIPFLSKPYTDDAILAALDRLHRPA